MQDEIDALAQGEVVEIWGDADVEIQRLVAGVWMTFSRVSKPSSREPLYLTGQEGSRYVVANGFIHRPGTTVIAPVRHIEHQWPHILGL
jgi:hypothetical protein